MSWTRNTLLLIAAAVLAQSAFADTGQVFNGSNVGGPTWNRPIGSGPDISGNTVSYHVQQFKLETDSTCILYSSQDFDGYLHLYPGVPGVPFDSSDPLANLIAGDDDGVLDVGTSQLGEFDLQAGTYNLVTSGFSASSAGSFQNVVQCDGDVQAIHGSCAALFPNHEREEEVCLLGRFLTVIDWETNSASGHGTPVRTGSAESALFWFFNDRNWEVMVKVLDGCAINGHYWVFLGALTNQTYTVSVGDSTTLAVKTYTNNRPTNSPAFTDTTAFACN